MSGLAAGYFYVMPGSIDNAKQGDCASYDRSDLQDPYGVVRCDSSAAVFTVLKVVDGEENCRRVASANRSTISIRNGARHEICMGPKGVDPATAINVAQPGDCLTGTSDDQSRVPCTDPRAKMKIIERLDALTSTEVPTACDEVPGAVSVYTWTWDADDGTGPAQASNQADAVFCLGPVR